MNGLHTHSWLAAILAVLIILAVAACGGSSNNSGTHTSATQGTNTSGNTALTASVEGICARRNAAVEAAGTQITSEKKLEAIARKRAAAEQQALTELTKLTVPATLQPAWREFIADRQKLVTDWARVSHQGFREDRTGAFIISLEQVQHAMLTAAHRTGFKQCAQIN